MNLLHSRPTLSQVLGLGSTFVLVGCAIAAVYIALGESLSARGPQPPEREPRTPQAATPTPQIPDPRFKTAEEASTFIGSNVALDAVVDAVLQGDMGVLMSLLHTEEKVCSSADSGRDIVSISCEDAGLPEGSTVAMVEITDNTEFWVTTEFARAVLADAFAQATARLTFLYLGTDASYGVALTVEPTRSPRAPFELAGAWFDIDADEASPIRRIRLLSSDWGPQQLFHRSYAAAGGEVLYNDLENSPGLRFDLIPTPPPPPTMQP